jgi:hypothetical protein
LRARPLGPRAGFSHAFTDPINPHHPTRDFPNESEVLVKSLAAARAILYHRLKAFTFFKP